MAYRECSDAYVDEGAAAEGLGPVARQVRAALGLAAGIRLAQPAANDNAPGCRIKGNLNRDGERIYHMPGGRWYDRTRISEAKGERWFCSEAEARAAGWRPANQ